MSAIDELMTERQFLKLALIMLAMQQRRRWMMIEFVRGER
jgi:hypothetical protein